MSIARALTTRHRKVSTAADNTAPSYLGRAASQRSPNAKPIKRDEISLPVALLSTTNVLSYEAPDIPNAPHVRDRGGRYFSPAAVSSAISVGSSAQSDFDSENTASDHSHETDATSIDLSSPETAQDKFTRFGSTNFPKSSGTIRSVRSTVSSQASHATSLSSDSSPMIPTRAPSHSKNAHVLAHKRSVLARGSVEPPRSPSRHDSFDMFNSVALNHLDPSSATATVPPPSSHPFGKELEQLNEAAEEFGYAVRNAEADADLAIMRAKGLVCFCAADYMDEIAALSTNLFAADVASYQPMAWI